jgi:hyperosmotically inducible protein
MKHIQQMLALAFFSALLAGCATTENTAKKEEAKPAASAAAADPALTKSVQAALTKEAQLKGTKVTVNATTDGAVTLGGETTNDWQKYLAGDLAKKTDGVKSVKNSIKVP